MKKLLKNGVLAVAVAVGATAALAGSAQADDAPSAWKKWMKENVVAAKAASDWKKLEDSMGRIKKANPDEKTFPKWGQYSDDGIAAAKAKDKDALNKSCNACHNDYRKIFREKFKDAPAPK